MPTSTLEGIIIKRSNFGEADRILTIVTPFRGKITVLAKGVRRITSRRGGNVELLNKIRFQVFQGSGLPILTEAESLKTFPKIKKDLMLGSYANHIAELAGKFLPEEQANLLAYWLIDNILDLLEENPRQIFIRAFEIKLLAALGFWSIDQVDTTDEIKNLLKIFQTNSWGEIAALSLLPEQALELERILRYYIERVLESSLKSARMIDKLKEEQ